MISVDHTALLLPDLDRALRVLGAAGFEIGERARFAAEGTEEVYVGPPEQQNLLLLQAPLGEGPYARALAKRGPGLHHIALAVADFAAFNLRLRDLGWWVHPNSLIDYRAGQTVYYLRPGVQTVLEVIPKTSLNTKPSPNFISHLQVPVQASCRALISGLGVSALKPVTEGVFALWIDEQKWTLETLIDV